MKITGKVYETYIEQKNSKKGDTITISHIVLRKTKNGKQYFLDFISFEEEKMKSLGVVTGDKVTIKFLPKSSRWNDKYFTSLYIENCQINQHSGNKKFVSNQLTDLETGEIIGFETEKSDK
jgi:hypothetical protein